MGLISSLAAPSAPQFQSVLTRPLPKAVASQVTPPLDQAALPTNAAQSAEAPTELLLRPVVATAASEAIFKGLLPVGTVMAELAEEVETAQIEMQSEVDGISLDGIPYLNDGAVLLDDLPVAEPAAEVKARPATSAAAMAAPAAMAVQLDALAGQKPSVQALSDQAERAYQDERAISALRPEAAPAESQTTRAKPQGAAGLALVQAAVPAAEASTPSGSVVNTAASLMAAPAPLDQAMQAQPAIGA